MKLKNRKLDAISSKLLCVLAVLVALTLVIVIIFASKGPRGEVLKTPERIENIEISASSVTLQKTADYGQNYIDSIIFLGDRTVKGLLDFELLSGGSTSYQVWTGEGGDISLDSNIQNISVVFPDSGEVIKLSDALSRRTPKYLVITLGISNGVPYCDKDKFCAYYQSFIDKVRESAPNTAIIIQSILPVSKKTEKQNPAISNERIDRANEWLVEICQNNNLKFLYTADALKDDNGRLAADYISDDGLSMNDDGYRQVLRYIRMHGYN